MGAEIMMIASAGMSYTQARQQNRAMRQGQQNSMEAYRKNIAALQVQRGVAQEQVEDSAEVEQMKNYYTGLMIGGKVLALAAAAGTTTSMEGTGSRMLTQSWIDSLRNARLIDQNRVATIERIHSDYMSGAVGAANQYTQVAHQYYSQMQNPFIAGGMGGMSGYYTGTQITAMQT